MALGTSPARGPRRRTWSRTSSRSPGVEQEAPPSTEKPRPTRSRRAACCAGQPRATPAPAESSQQLELAADQRQWRPSGRRKRPRSSRSTRPSPVRPPRRPQERPHEEEAEAVDPTSRPTRRLRPTKPGQSAGDARNGDGAAGLPARRQPPAPRRSTRGSAITGAGAGATVRSHRVATSANSLPKPPEVALHG